MPSRNTKEGFRRRQKGRADHFKYRFEPDQLRAARSSQEFTGSANHASVTAQNLWDSNDRKQAIAILKTAINDHPRNTVILCQLSAFLRQKNKPTEALKYAETAYSIDPRQERCANMLARALLDTARQLEDKNLKRLRIFAAIDICHKAIKKHPNNTYLHETLVSAYMGVGEEHEAFRTAKEAAALGSKDDFTSSIIQRYQERFSPGPVKPAGRPFGSKPTGRHYE